MLRRSSSRNFSSLAGNTPAASAIDLPSYGRRRREALHDYDSESEGNEGDYSYGGYGFGSTSAPPLDFKDKALPPRGSGFVNRLRLWMWRFRIYPSLPLLVLAAFFFFTTLRYRSQQRNVLHTLQANSLDEVVEGVERLREENRRWERGIFAQKGTERETHARYTALERSSRMLQKERDELRVKYESPERRNDELRIMNREEAWKQQVHLLQQATVREARRAAIEKFGPGPHYVQINVILASDKIGTDRSFVLEMAPLKSMPHSVHLFLEQVSHKLWDNAYFYLNGPHVMQGGPQAQQSQVEKTGLDERTLAMRPFVDLQLDHLAFPEYSDEFPHVPWTVGFAGRPGGPDFYINKVDNTASHGPGGQYQHDLDEYADPCFAKVVDGFDTLQAMLQETTYSEGSDYAFFLEEPVQVVMALVTGSPKRIRADLIATEASITGSANRKLTSGSRKRSPEKMARPKIEHQVEP